MQEPGLWWKTWASASAWIFTSSRTLTAEVPLPCLQSREERPHPGLLGHQQVAQGPQGCPCCHCCSRRPLGWLLAAEGPRTHVQRALNLQRMDRPGMCWDRGKGRWLAAQRDLLHLLVGEDSGKGLGGAVAKW